MRHQAANPSVPVLSRLEGSQRRKQPPDLRYLVLHARTLIESDHLALRLAASFALIAGVAVAVLEALSMVAGF